MTSPLRLALAASSMLAAAVLIAGCAASPGSSVPTSNATPDGSDSTPDDSDTTPDDEYDDIDAVWLDDGRMFGLVTWGSSTCVPVVGDATAEGQTVTVALVDPPSDDDSEKVCTTDIDARASLGALPEGVDPTQDVELIVTFGDITDDVDLDGNAALTGTPGSSTEFASSAGWYDDDGIVLLTWGSSSCPPVVEAIDVQEGGATVTFLTEDRTCTMDMAPRATILGISNDDDDDSDDADFTLTLVGDRLDGTVQVLRG